ncbi:nuclear factor erythroid 2-related factor 3 [Ochotona princeps]|uniref:nuclear factor erythroid 2-related factor 3 n=1 Tax=Ochotona princeps TaxID=9978 RepID=UPI002714C4E7|nr:nuclear factor erythroid 2-related factor 3 [Ochotona princeps]
MKLLKPWGTAGGGLLHLTVLLSLAGLRLDLDLDLDLLLPPSFLLQDEALLLGDPGSSAYNLSPFPWGGGEHAGHPHPKDREPDPAGPPEGHWLREVRALGVPFIPRLRVDAWLVHSVAGGDTEGTHGLLSAAASTGGIGASVDGGSHAAPGSSGDSRLARSSPVTAEGEDKVPAEPTAQVPDAGGGASQIQLHGTETPFSLEDFVQLLPSQPEFSLEGLLFGEILPFPSNVTDGIDCSAPQQVDFSQALSHDVNLQEAMVLRPNSTFRSDPTATTFQVQEPFVQFNPLATHPEPTFPGADLLRPDNHIPVLTSPDPLCDLDTNMFEEISLLSLATEEDFDPGEISQLFEEPASDSGLSLNANHYGTSVPKSSSSHFIHEGATGSNGDLDSLSHHQLEGAVGGYSLELSQFCHTANRSFHQDLAFQSVFHNHTYHLQPFAPESTVGTSRRTSRCPDDRGTDLSRDERCAKALRLPFPVDDIVHMPIDSFNSMLRRSYLTDLQVSFIRDIRRRGKNRAAAQNCRKRKLDIICNLEDDVYNLQTKKEILKSEQAQFNKAINVMKQKLCDVYRDIFNRLRDDQGRPVNPNQYVLQCNRDGSVLIVPRELAASGHKKDSQEGKRKK